MANILNYKLGSLPLKYLEIYIFDGHLNLRIVTPVLEKWGKEWTHGRVNFCRWEVDLF